jgi:hypothetical protein
MNYAGGSVRTNAQPDFYPGEDGGNGTGADGGQDGNGQRESLPPMTLPSGAIYTG